MKARRAVIAAVLAVLALAQVAAAQLYTVRLHSGKVFETRYAPELAAWDESKVVFLSDVGNWISIDRDEVAEVVSQLEARGFGRMIDDNTIALGWLANDAPTDEELAAQAADPTARLLNYLQSQQQVQDFSVQQFVEPGEAGTGGLPAFGLAPGYNAPVQGVVPPETTFPMGGSGPQPSEPDTINQ